VISFLSAEDAQNHANSEQSDAILYIGGPPNPNQKCRNNDQFGHIINNFQTNSTELALSDEESDFQEADCDCRQWAFQFLRPIIRKSTPSSPTSDITDPLLEDTTTDDDIDNETKPITTENEEFPQITKGNKISPVEFSDDEIVSVTTTRDNHVESEETLLDNANHPLDEGVHTNEYDYTLCMILVRMET